MKVSHVARPSVGISHVHITSFMATLHDAIRKRPMLLSIVAVATPRYASTMLFRRKLITRMQSHMRNQRLPPAPVRLGPRRPLDIADTTPPEVSRPRSNVQTLVLGEDQRSPEVENVQHSFPADDDSIASYKQQRRHVGRSWIKPSRPLATFAKDIRAPEQTRCSHRAGTVIALCIRGPWLSLYPRDALIPNIEGGVWGIWRCWYAVLTRVRLV